MTQRMYNIDKWETLPEGKALQFSNPKARNVRIEVNAPQKSALYYIDEAGEVHFLALVEGRDTIEFGSTGAFAITVEGSPVSIYTADGADISSVIVGAEPFTKIVERRRRNPELELMAQMMQRNMERMLNQQASEREQLLSRRLAALEAQSATASVPVSSGTEQTTTDGAGTSGAPAPAADGGGTDAASVSA